MDWSDMYESKCDESTDLRCQLEAKDKERKDAITRAEKAEADSADLQASADLRWNSDMRAIKRWQEAHPGNELVWPDHTDLSVWLMEQLEQREAEVKEVMPSEMPILQPDIGAQRQLPDIKPTDASVTPAGDSPQPNCPKCGHPKMYHDICAVHAPTMGTECGCSWPHEPLGICTLGHFCESTAAKVICGLLCCPYCGAPLSFTGDHEQSDSPADPPEAK